MHICIEGVQVIHSVLVSADVTQDCLLGVDSLGKHGCKINFEAKTILLVLEIRLLDKSGSNKVFRISLAETVVVPCRHEMVLEAKFKCDDGMLGLVEQSPGFAEQHNLLLV